MFSGIQNYYEKLVFQRIQEELASGDEDFMEDVACVALNQLPSRYIRFSVDLASHLSLKDQDALQAQVAKAVDEAVALVEKRRAQRDLD